MRSLLSVLRDPLILAPGLDEVEELGAGFRASNGDIGGVEPEELVGVRS